MRTSKLSPVAGHANAFGNESRVSRLRQGATLVTLLWVLVAFVACTSNTPEQKSTTTPGTMDAPLTEFDQKITSDVRQLTVSPGGTFEIPVTITNPTKEAWSSGGKYPVVVSYKWFDNGVQIALEGDRTRFPATVPPGGSVQLTVKGTAPQSGSNLVVRITLVQEAVAWFEIKGAPSLPIPAKLQ